MMLITVNNAHDDILSSHSNIVVDIELNMELPGKTKSS